MHTQKNLLLNLFIYVKVYLWELGSLGLGMCFDSIVVQLSASVLGNLQCWGKEITGKQHGGTYQ